MAKDKKTEETATKTATKKELTPVEVGQQTAAKNVKEEQAAQPTGE